MHPETHTHTHTHTHISAACGRHPQRCETSCIPHAYITPSPPPPADHSSLYHFILRWEGKTPLLSSLSLSLPLSSPLLSSLSLSLKSARRAPSAIEHDFVTLGASKEHIAAMRSGCSKSHLYWRFYVGKNWIINLRHLWQHGSSNVKPCYHPALLIFTEGEDSIRGMKNCIPALYCCRLEIAKLLRQNEEPLWRE